MSFVCDGTALHAAAAATTYRTLGTSVDWLLLYRLALLHGMYLAVPSRPSLGTAGHQSRVG